jgi:thymidylate synthase (FAD)
MTITTEQYAEITAQREQTFITRRTTVPGLEQHLFTPFPILDHGFIRVIDYMGGDESIIRSARVSYGKGTRTVSEDKGLISYLMRHHHTTPFESPIISLHIKAPLFVMRQWHRHRTASINEISARYSILDKEFYIPTESQLAIQSSTNRQGRGELIDPVRAARVLEILKADALRCYDHYEEMLDVDDTGTARDPAKPGLARELARINLTLNSYSSMVWTCNLHNALNFLRLRNDSHAQYEIRVYAEKMFEIFSEWVPMTTAAFKEHRIDAYTLSGPMLQTVRRMLKGEAVTHATSGLSKRDWAELMTKTQTA